MANLGLLNTINPGPVGSISGRGPLIAVRPTVGALANPQPAVRPMGASSWGCVVAFSAPPWFGGGFTVPTYLGPVPNRSIRGLVRQQNVPISSATVRLYLRRTGMLASVTWTASDGTYEFKDIPFEAEGYYAVALDPAAGFFRTR